MCKISYSIDQMKKYVEIDVCGNLNKHNQPWLNFLKYALNIEMDLISL